MYMYKQLFCWGEGGEMTSPSKNEDVNTLQFKNNERIYSTIPCCHIIIATCRQATRFL